MDPNSELKGTLEIIVSNAVSRMEGLKDVADRRAVFHEYKEWLAEPLSVDVWALPRNWHKEKKKEVDF